MSLLDAILLGLVQGLTEFLPVSSSGHLVLAGHLLGWQPKDVSFEVIVHFATALAILTVYRKEIAPLFLELPRCLFPKRYRENWRERPVFRLVILLGLSAIPDAVVGLLLKDALEEVFRDVRLVGSMLIVTALWLALGRFRPKRTRPLGVVPVVIMSFAQTLAILPGLSRSGLTITSGLWGGLSREDAARFSFLMVLAPLLGAALLEVVGGLESTAGAPALLAGGIAAYLSGVLALKLLLRAVARGRLDLFAPYCFVVGLVARFA